MTRRRALLGGACAITLGRALTSALAQPAERTVRIVAHKFEYQPRAITLKRGEPVVFELSSLDVIMGFNIPAFKLRADIPPGPPTLLRFTPDQAGEFVFYCDVFCGNGHEEMDGSLVVTA